MRVKLQPTSFIAVLLFLSGCITSATSYSIATAAYNPTADRTAPSVAVGDDTVAIAAAGDIACDPDARLFNGGVGTTHSCHMKATSDLLLDMAPAAVLTLGDNQYESASYENFMASFDRSWGRLKNKLYPAIGNHEGESADAGEGYCEYFGAIANCNADGSQAGSAYYSFEVGRWHLVVLNSNCSAAGGCDVGSPQYQWLVADLAAHPSKCTLAYWHHPRVSSGDHGNHTRMADIFSALYNAGVELVLSGHDHDYERFAPQNPDLGADPKKGVRQFVVGTGGKNLYTFNSEEPNSEVMNSQTFGVLKLTLHPESYDWEFVPEAGKTFTDKGKGLCH